MANIHKILCKIKVALNLQPAQASHLLETVSKQYDDSGPSGNDSGYQDDGPSAASHGYQDGGPKSGAQIYQDGGSKNANVHTYDDGGPKKGSDSAFHQAMAGLAGKQPNEAIVNLVHSMPHATPLKILSTTDRLEKADPKHRMGQMMLGLYSRFEEEVGKGASDADFFDWADKLTYFEFVALLKQKGTSHRGIQDQAKGFLTGVQYMSKAVRAEFRVKVKGGILMQGGEPYDTSENSTMICGLGWAIWVMSPHNRIYAGSHIKSQLHHSSFLSGGDIRGAGEWRVRGGVVEIFTGKSGHYCPTVRHLQASIREFKRKGLHLKKSVVAIIKIGELKAVNIPCEEFLKWDDGKCGNYTPNFNSSDASFKTLITPAPAAKITGMAGHRA